VSALYPVPSFPLHFKPYSVKPYGEDEKTATSAISNNPYTESSQGVEGTPQAKNPSTLSMNAIKLSQQPSTNHKITTPSAANAEGNWELQAVGGKWALVDAELAQLLAQHWCGRDGKDVPPEKTFSLHLDNFTKVEISFRHMVQINERTKRERLIKIQNDLFYYSSNLQDTVWTQYTESAQQTLRALRDEHVKAELAATPPSCPFPPDFTYVSGKVSFLVSK
jgi:hypothetical protein